MFCVCTPGCWHWWRKETPAFHASLNTFGTYDIIKKPKETQKSHAKALRYFCNNPRIIHPYLFQFCPKTIKLKVAERAGEIVFSPNRQTKLFSWAKILNFSHSKWLKSCQIRTWSCSECSNKALEQLQVLIGHDLSHLAQKKSKF